MWQNCSFYRVLLAGGFFNSRFINLERRVMGESEQFSKFSLHVTEDLSDIAFHNCICRLVPVGCLATKPLYAIQCRLQNQETVWKCRSCIVDERRSRAWLCEKAHVYLKQYLLQYNEVHSLAHHLIEAELKKEREKNWYRPYCNCN